MDDEFVIDIPEYFSGDTRWCFHNAINACPFAWRDPGGHYYIDGDDNAIPCNGDKVHCTLGLNDADTESTEYYFSTAGSDCPGPGKYKLARVGDPDKTEGW